MPVIEVEGAVRPHQLEGRRERQLRRAEQDEAPVAASDPLRLQRLAHAGMIHRAGRRDKRGLPREPSPRIIRRMCGQPWS